MDFELSLKIDFQNTYTLNLPLLPQLSGNLTTAFARYGAGAKLSHSQLPPA